MDDQLEQARNNQSDAAYNPSYTAGRTHELAGRRRCILERSKR
ncbi:MAG TPA: hypothetical protein VKV73_04555 [Chloroflexota bacterium]|nr:hypothetical protein [Chloroflexota bacterium]